MKHGVKIFQKKLNRSPEHRLALLRNLSSDLLLHGRIETTVPKAKFLRHAADQLIDWAKSGTEKEQKKIHQFIFQHALTLPKLRLLAARFEGRNGGYTRIIRNGLRAKGDKAPLAIVEYVDNKNDTIRLLAKKHLGKVENDLTQLQSERYNITKISIVDPVTKEPVTVTRQKLRADVTSKETKKFVWREAFLKKLVNKLRKSEMTGPIAQEKEAKELEKMEKEKDARDMKKLLRLQNSIDAMPEDKRKALVERLSTRPVSADVLLSRKAAEREGKTKTLKMNEDGKLYWALSSEPRRRFNVVNLTEDEAQQDAATSSEKSGEKGGIFGKIIGGFGGRKK